MGFEKFLYDHFPHRWLDPKKSGTQRMIVGLAKTLDYCNELLETVKLESRTVTATHSLPTREVEYGLPISPELPTDQRRRRIIAAKRERGGATAKPVFEDGLSLLAGTPVKLVPLVNQYAVIFEISTSHSLDFRTLDEYVERMKRAHVRHDFSANTSTEPIIISASSRSFEVDYPICGEFYAEDDLEGRIYRETVVIAEGARFQTVTYPETNDFYPEPEV